MAVRRTLAAGLLTFGAVVASAATAAADPPEPPPPPDPAAPPPIGPASFLPNGALAPGSGYDFLLSQAPVPSVPGTQPAVGTFLDPQAIQSLRPINFGLAGQGQDSLYSYAPAAPDAPPGGLLDNIRGARGLFHYPMGKLDVEQLGQPLPGTAPPPGTNIPLGLNWPEPPPPAPEAAPPPPSG